MTPDQFAWISSALQMHGCKRLGTDDEGQLAFEQMHDVLTGLALRYNATSNGVTQQSGSPNSPQQQQHRASGSGRPPAQLPVASGSGSPSNSNVKLTVEAFESIAHRREASRPGSRRGSQGGALMQIGDGEESSATTPPASTKARISASQLAAMIPEGKVAAVKMQLASPGRGPGSMPPQGIGSARGDGRP